MRKADSVSARIKQQTVYDRNEDPAEAQALRGFSFPSAPFGFRNMNTKQPNNPLHGITLEKLLNELVASCGWEELGRQINIRCFQHEPSIASSLKFLRRTPWAREQVESLYLSMLRWKSGR